jgi:hypothetical protein
MGSEGDLTVIQRTTTILNLLLSLRYILPDWSCRRYVTGCIMPALWIGDFPTPASISGVEPCSSTSLPSWPQCMIAQAHTGRNARRNHVFESKTAGKQSSLTMPMHESVLRNHACSISLATCWRKLSRIVQIPDNSSAHHVLVL